MKYCILILCLSLVSCIDTTTVKEAGADYKNNFVYTNSHNQKIICVNDLKQWCAKNPSAEIISICVNRYQDGRIAIAWLIVYKDGVASAEFSGK